MALSRFRHAVRVAVLALPAIVLTGAANAAVKLDPAERPTSLAGSYLAGRSADIANDIDAALAYLSYTLEVDRGNPVLGDRVLTLQLAAGEIEPALGLAEKIIITDTENASARIALAVSAVKKDRYALAKQELDKLSDSPLTKLTSGLIRAWADQGLGKTDQALADIDGLTGPSWYEIFKDYHRALIADAAGRKAEADAAITATYEKDNTPLGIVEAYARIKARNGERDEALSALDGIDPSLADNALITELTAELKAGKTPSPVASTVQSGVAEVFYGLGSAIGTEEGTSLAASYLQLAHYLEPSDGLITLALGDIFQRADQCDKAIEIYGKVPKTSPIRRNALIQSALCLDTLGRTDEGAAQIKSVIESNPNDVEAAVALGGLYRAKDRFAEAADAYTLGINSIADETEADWRIYYYRGISYERTQRWQQAEADFKHALELNPNQPQVLNYLGYSWIDMGLNLDKAMDMIRTAVDLRPNDGYIIDSLGWAYYRLGKYDDAVEQLEHAVELRPEDPVINDHLGDAYWQVGRKREATFQWAHARDLGADESELPKILDKLQHGLPAGNSEEKSDASPVGDAVETTVSAVDPADGASPQSSITVETGDSLSTIAKKVYGNPDLYLRIFDANKDRIADPNVIHPGMTLIIPAPEMN